MPRLSGAKVLFYFKKTMPQKFLVNNHIIEIIIIDQ